MKFLIWAGCILGLNILLLVIRKMGIILGGLPVGLLHAGMFWPACTLCKKSDEKRYGKKDNGKNG